MIVKVIVKQQRHFHGGKCEVRVPIVYGSEVLPVSEVFRCHQRRWEAKPPTSGTSSSPGPNIWSFEPDRRTTSNLGPVVRTVSAVAVLVSGQWNLTTKGEALDLVLLTLTGSHICTNLAGCKWWTNCMTKSHVWQSESIRQKSIILRISDKRSSNSTRCALDSLREAQRAKSGQVKQKWASTQRMHLQ